MKHCTVFYEKSCRSHLLIVKSLTQVVEPGKSLLHTFFWLLIACLHQSYCIPLLVCDQSGVLMASSSSTACWKHSVFLSFRGEDTRRNFVSHLYKALDRFGIDTFKDDITLQRGQHISQGLLKAIEGSRFSVVVMSENYAFSSWCLDELVKIIECRESMGQTVLPIFYNVDPSDVENQSGVFAVAFAEHEKSCKDNMCLVQSWRDALTKVASISGWDSRDWDESTLIEEIVRDISDRLFFTSNTDAEDLVGIDSSIEEMNSLLCLGSNDVRMIGLWGMGGVGKTTIARVVYNRLSSRFEAKCFLANVKERFKKDGAVSVTERFLSTIFMEKTPSHCLLQADPNMARERLCHKRSIIVLDDVDKMEQLEILSNRCDWFGLGSRIIITTRDRHLLVAHEVEHIYEVKSLENDHSLMLFNQFAFRKRPVPEEYSELSKHVVHYAKGLPLALKVLGSFLCHRSKQDWESALKKLENIPNPEVQNVLRISYDSLDDEQKDIFLDIACFFNGMRKDQVTEFLDGCGFCTNIGISVLIDKSLLTIPSNMLEMYDLLQEMGWEIVRQESVKDPGKRSRLWIPTDVYRVLTNNMGSEKVEGILLDFSKSRSMQLGATTFAAMCNLRFLKFYDSTSPEAADTCKVNLPEGLQSLSDCLRHLHWHRYPLKSLPSRFSPENLVVLNLPHSSIEQLWHGNQDLINLKQIDLSHCTNLVGNVDLSMAPNLEQIMMNGCTSLHEAYMPHLNKLKFLTFSNCKRLLSVPSTINAKSLKTMSLFGCSSLTKFPEVSQNIEYFDMSETALEELPSSVQYLTELDRLNLERCKRLQHLPTTICKLKSLGFLDLSGCERLRNFPEILEIMDHLHTLKLEGTGIKELHPSIENLSGLKWLYLNHCQNFELLPSSIWSLQSLEDLFLSDCPKLTRVPPLTKLRNFPSLHLEENSLLSTLRVPHQLFSISSLDLQGSNIESIPANIKELPQLYTLNLRSCQRLTSLPELPLSLIKMVAQDCISLRTVSTSWCSATPEKWITNANYYYTNCFNLSENAQSNIVRNFLRRTKYISASSFEDGVFHSFKFHHGFYSLPVLESSIPGSEVPEFFRYQSRGSSLTAHLPANWYNSKFMGFAMCAVVEFKSSYSDSDFIDHLNHNADSQKHISSFLVLCHFTSYDHSARSDHILMGYDPFLARGIEGDDWLDKSKVAFKFNIFEGIGPPSPPYQVKKCGVGLIYDQDKEYLIANKRSYDKYFGGHGGETSENRRQKWKFR